MDDERWQSILKLFGELRAETKEHEASVLRQQSEHWKAVTIAIRTLTDWWTDYADRETAERKERQVVLDERLMVIQRDQGIIQHNQRLWIRAVVFTFLLAAGLIVGALVL